MTLLYPHYLPVPRAFIPRNSGVTGVGTPRQQQNRGATCLVWCGSGKAEAMRGFTALHGTSRLQTWIVEVFVNNFEKELQDVDVNWNEISKNSLSGGDEIICEGCRDCLFGPITRKNGNSPQGTMCPSTYKSIHNPSTADTATTNHN